MGSVPVDHLPVGHLPPLISWLAMLLFCSCVMFLLWLRQLRTSNATSVDAAFAALTGFMGVAFAMLGEGAPLQRWLAGLIAGFWGGRLTYHLLRDRVLGHRAEDGRYKAMRDHFGARANWCFLVFYQLQAVTAGVFALPFLLIAQHKSTALLPLQWLGLSLTVFGFCLETLADTQLASHRKDPAQRGRTCRVGLWRFSRHPNYFGEWLLWCGIGLLGMSAPYGGFALIAPVLMFLLIRFVSGVPFAEQQSLRSRGDDYRSYMKTTNTFFPWLPHGEGRR